MCVNEELIRLGLGRVEHIEGLVGNTFYLRLSERLVKAEIYAEKKGVGVWTRPSLRERLTQWPRDTKQSVSGYMGAKLHDFKLMFSWKKTKASGAKTSTETNAKDRTSESKGE